MQLQIVPQSRFSGCNRQDHAGYGGTEKDIVKRTTTTARQIELWMEVLREREKKGIIIEENKDL